MVVKFKMGFGCVFLLNYKWFKNIVYFLCFRVRVLKVGFWIVGFEFKKNLYVLERNNVFLFVFLIL